MDTPLKPVLALSSEVGIGGVGLSISRYVFAAEKVPLISLPTVSFASRPDMGTIARHDIPASSLDKQLDALASDEWFGGLSGIVTGYFCSSHQVEITASHIQRLKQDNPTLPIVIDPVIGDFDTGLYGTKDVGNAIKELLLPLASVISPNLFEFLWLSGQSPGATLSKAYQTDELLSFAHQAKIERVVITSSAQSTEGSEIPSISTLLIEANRFHHFSNSYYEDVPKGTGDVFAAHLLCKLVKGTSLARATELTVRYMERIAGKTHETNQIEPYLLLSSH